ncbi:hypothetical protein BGX26_002857 [Mortierella sp. AD094]|nr:hypothetical protein BGX26_002857 [Mortierella sp. AD094]
MLRATWVENRLTMLDVRDWQSLDVTQILSATKAKDELEILRISYLTHELYVELTERSSGTDLRLTELTISELSYNIDELQDLLSKAPHLQALNLLVAYESISSFLDRALSGLHRTTADISISTAWRKNPFRLTMAKGQMVMLDCVGWSGRQYQDIVRDYGAGHEIIWLDDLTPLDLDNIVCATSASISSLKEVSIWSQCCDIKVYENILKQMPRLSRLELIINNSHIGQLFAIASSSRPTDSSLLEILVRTSRGANPIQSNWRSNWLVKIVCEGEFLHTLQWTNSISSAILVGLEELEITTPVHDTEVLRMVLENSPGLCRLKLTLEIINTMGLIELISNTQVSKEHILDWTFHNPSGTAEIKGCYENGLLTVLDCADWSFDDLALFIRDHGAGLRHLRLDDIDEDTLRAISWATANLTSISVVKPKFEISKLGQLLGLAPNIYTIQLSVVEDEYLSILDAIYDLKERVSDMCIRFSHPVAQDLVWSEFTISRRAESEHPQPGKNGYTITRWRLRDLMSHKAYPTEILNDPTTGTTIDILNHTQVAELRTQIHHDDHLNAIGTLEINVWQRLEINVWQRLETIDLSDYTLNSEQGLQIIHSGLYEVQHKNMSLSLQDVTYGAKHSDHSAIVYLKNILLLTPLQRVKIWTAMDIDATLDLIESIKGQLPRYLNLNATGFNVNDVQRILDILIYFLKQTRLETLVLQNAKLHHRQVVQMGSRGVQLCSDRLRGPSTITTLQ